MLVPPIEKSSVARSEGSNSNAPPGFAPRASVRESEKLPENVQFVGPVVNGLDSSVPLAKTLMAAAWDGPVNPSASKPAIKKLLMKPPYSIQ
jgi:hypothetical protein